MKTTIKSMRDSDDVAPITPVGRGSRPQSKIFITMIALAFAVAGPGIALADEGGVSFWLPGTFGSLAAVPAPAPGWSGATVYYHDSVSAGGDVSRAREIQIGRIPTNLTANVNANLNANLNLGMLDATYVFATPVFGGQASAGLLGFLRQRHDVAGGIAHRNIGDAGRRNPFLALRQHQ
jgi:hypothetical protein